MLRSWGMTAQDQILERIKALGIVESSVHTPVYTMHKYWARRPWPVFRRLIESFTKPGETILDPFAGGGVVLVEGLVARRRVIAVDLNPLAVKIMLHEVLPVDINRLRRAVERLKALIEPLERQLFLVRCGCGATSVADWIEHGWDKPLASHHCSKCNRRRVERLEEKLPEMTLQDLMEMGLRRVEIPYGEKTAPLLRRGIKYFDELFTGRNLYLILALKRAIETLEEPEEIRSFLLLTLSSTLKWASLMSHRRGEVLEGWAMHAYWIYPHPLEVNVWRQFLRRVESVARGKEWSNKHIGLYAVRAESVEDFLAGRGSYLLLQADSRHLPLPESCVDHVITDPPYGANVNYAELADYFLWLFGELAPKNSEIVINNTRGVTLDDYKRGLEEVFRECYRVLKPDGLLISTFNSKDMRVVGAFLSAVTSAGFTYLGTSLQPYLRAYTTTFHALQVDSLPFDPVFFFRKAERQVAAPIAPTDLSGLRAELMNELEGCKRRLETERVFRSRTYVKIIPILTSLDWDGVKSLTTFYERLVRRESRYFLMARRRLVEERRSRGNVLPEAVHR